MENFKLTHYCGGCGENEHDCLFLKDCTEENGCHWDELYGGKPNLKCPICNKNKLTK